MKKRIAAMVLAGAMALSLVPAYGVTEVKAEAGDMKIAMVTDSGDITDQSLTRPLTRHVRRGPKRMVLSSTIINQRATLMRHVTQVLTRL